MKAVIERRGLVVRVITDKVLFASGQATLQPEGEPLLEEVATLLNVDQSHPITVEGQHGQPADRDGAVPVQLGAVDGARDDRRSAS